MLIHRKGHGRVHRGYSKNYLDKEKIIGFELWLKDQPLAKNAKNEKSMADLKRVVDRKLKELRS